MSTRLGTICLRSCFATVSQCDAWSRLKLRNAWERIAPESVTPAALRLRSPQHLACDASRGTRSSLHGRDKRRLFGRIAQDHRRTRSRIRIDRRDQQGFTAFFPDISGAMVDPDAQPADVGIRIIRASELCGSRPGMTAQKKRNLVPQSRRPATASWRRAAAWPG